MSRKMNNDKAAEETKNLFADFKFLATKVNDDNKNRKEKLEETKKILQVCKQEYQKSLYERDTLKKILQVGTKSENSKTDTEKKKKKILIKTIKNKIERVMLPLLKMNLKLILMIMMTMTMMMITLKQSEKREIKQEL